MNHIYFNKEINAHFSVQSLDIYQKNIELTEMHKWFSVIIISELQGTVRIDNEDFGCDSSTVLFITPGQIISFARLINWSGYIVSFNSEFYCIEYHDSEISCKGLLFVNNFRIVNFELNEQQKTIYNNTILEIAREFETGEDLLDEMLKNLLKNLLIRSNRLFKQQYIIESEDINFEVIRKLSSLIEGHFRTHKQVEEYAEMMGLSASSLAKKLQKAGINSPSLIIRERIITEAKRMLIYSDKSIKEIAAFLGYDDQYYFSRLFSNSTGKSPSKYRVNYQIN